MTVIQMQPKFVVNVDLDERSYLFPDGKQVAQLRLLAFASGIVTIEAVYVFNQSRSSPILLELDREDAAEFARKFIEAVYRAQGTLIISDSMRVNVTVVANGYILQIGDPGAEKELYLGTGAIWRVCGGLLRVLDQVRPVVTN